MTTLEKIQELKIHKKNLETELTNMQPFSKLDRDGREKFYTLTDNIECLEKEIDHYERRAASLLEESNLGRRFKGRTFDSFDREKFPDAFDLVKAFAENFEQNKGEGIFLTGNPGTGKTHLAAAAANYIIKTFGIPVKFGSFTELLEGIKNSFGGNEDAGRELIDVPLLVIDDLGKERQSEWSRSVLYRVINGRYENYSPVIITTNETPQTVEKNIGEATFSRIFEMCDGVSMNGEDYRMKKLGGVK